MNVVKKFRPRGFLASRTCFSRKFPLSPMLRSPFTISKRFFHEVEDDGDDIKKGGDEDWIKSFATKMKRILIFSLQAIGLMIGGAFACLSLGLGDMADAKYYDSCVNDDEIFVEGSSDDRMKQQLRNGDVVFFHRKWWSYSPPTWAKIGLLKLVIKDSGWTGVGVVVLNQEEENEPWVVEIGFNGLKVTPYDMRVVTSRCDAIGFRHLRTQYTWDQVNALQDWLMEKMKEAEEGEGDTIGWKRLIHLFIRPSISRMALYGEKMNIDNSIKHYRADLENEENKHSRQRLLRKIKLLDTESGWYGLQIREKEEKVLNRIKRSYHPDYKLVAEAWTVLGIIDKEAPAKCEYLPSHFVDDIHFPFLQNAYLDPVTYVRCGVDPDNLEPERYFDRVYDDERKVRKFTH